MELAYQESQQVNTQSQDRPLAEPKRNTVAERAFVLGIILFITACEWIFAFRNVSYGIVLALALSVLIYLALSLIKFDPTTESCSEALALVPLYILFTSSLPWFFLDPQLRLPAVYVIVLVLCAWHIYLKGLDFKELGLKKDRFLLWAALGVLLALPLGFTEFFVISITPAYPEFHWKYLLRDLVYMTLFVGLGEELLFRSIIQTALKNLFGRWWGLFLAAAIFGVMHMTWRSGLEVFFTFCAGLAFGYFYEKTGSLTGPVIMHGVGNTILVAVMPYLKL